MQAGLQGFPHAVPRTCKQSWTVANRSLMLRKYGTCTTDARGGPQRLTPQAIDAADSTPLALDAEDSMALKRSLAVDAADLRRHVQPR